MLIMKIKTKSDVRNLIKQLKVKWRDTTNIRLLQPKMYFQNFELQTHWNEKLMLLNKDEIVLLYLTLEFNQQNSYPKRIFISWIMLKNLWNNMIRWQWWVRLLRFIMSKASHFLHESMRKVETWNEITVNWSNGERLNNIRCINSLKFPLKRKFH